MTSHNGRKHFLSTIRREMHGIKGNKETMNRSPDCYYTSIGDYLLESQWRLFKSLSNFCRRSPIGHFFQINFKASVRQVPGNHILGIKLIFLESILGNISVNLYSILIIDYRGDI